jgi:hypothetical protein
VVSGALALPLRRLVVAAGLLLALYYFIHGLAMV